jgi:hypothetical protein
MTTTSEPAPRHAGCALACGARKASLLCLGRAARPRAVPTPVRRDSAEVRRVARSLRQVWMLESAAWRAAHPCLERALRPALGIPRVHAMRHCAFSLFQIDVNFTSYNSLHYHTSNSTESQSGNPVATQPQPQAFLASCLPGLMLVRACVDLCRVSALGLILSATLHSPVILRCR